MLFKVFALIAIIDSGFDIFRVRPILLNAWQSVLTIVLLIEWLFLLDFIYYIFEFGTMLKLATVSLLRPITRRIILVKEWFLLLYTLLIKELDMSAIVLD